MIQMKTYHLAFSFNYHQRYETGGNYQDGQFPGHAIRQCLADYPEGLFSSLALRSAP